MSRYGVIDLGTNTFHLLIAELAAGGSFREIYRERRFIKLGENGLHHIGQAPWQRGMATMREFKQRLQEHEVSHVRAIGTAALRTAANGTDFVRQVQEETGIAVELISGDREAHLIQLGVRLAVPFGQQPFLIMDIGGGSVEFILANEQQVFWAQSFPIGLAVLYHRFHREDPLPTHQVEAMHYWLDEQLAPLSLALQQHPPLALVGAAGAFEVVEDMIDGKTSSGVYSSFPSSAFDPVLHRILPSSVAERLLMDKLPESRADMFVVSLVLIDHLLRKTGVEMVYVSAYALKEGVLLEMVDGR